MQRIGMVLDAHYPHDIRVAKEAYSLIEAGYEVHLVCLRRDKEAISEEIDGLKIHRIDASKTKLTKGIWDIRLTFNFRHPLFIKALRSLVKEKQISVLHIHDLPLCKSGIEVGREFKIPVICDFHENYPEGLKTWFTWRTNPLIRIKNRIFFGFEKWKKYEGWVSKSATHIIAVVDEMKEKIASDFSIDQEKVSVITNSESVSFVNQDPDDDVYKEYPGQFIITYCGNVGPHRGVDTAIKGLSYLKDLKIKLIIAGNTPPAIKKRLVKIAAEYNVKSSVKFSGYQPFNRFYSIMHAASVNIIPHNMNGHTNHTVPHKLFQSMMAARPVLVSSCKPLKRIVEETRCGLVFEADNPVDFADKIRIMYENETLSTELGKNGYHHSVKGNYNWEYTSRQLINCYKKILS